MLFLGRKPTLFRLTDDIAISAQPDERHWAAIRRLGYRGVVDLREETAGIEPLVQSHDLHYLRVPVVEWAAPTSEQLYEITGWVTGHALAGEPVLVYCREGRGRSAMVAVACLVRLGLPVSEANSLLMRARPAAMLNRTQSRALEAFAASVQANRAA